MITVDVQKWEADQILKKAEVLDPTCIIAGGAARDWYMGIVATDLDLFIHFPLSRKITQIINQLKAVSLTVVKVLGPEEFPAGYKLNPNISYVFEVTAAGVSTPCQIIVYSKPTFGVVEQFPLSICQAWYKGGKIGFTNEFASSVRNKVIIRTSDLYADAHAYVTKIRNKFPDYRYYDSWGSYGKMCLLENKEEL